MLRIPPSLVLVSAGMAKRKVPARVHYFFKKLGQEGGRPRHKTEIPPEKRKAIAQKAARARWSKRKKRPA